VLSAAIAAPIGVQAGWPFYSEGPRRGSVEWYEMHAGDPIGQRQTFRFGKVWPAQPRPVGPPAPCVHRFHHNTYWPSPYRELDAASVQMTAEIQVLNGWQDATTLYEYHFDPETHTLNKAGQRHLFWILSSVPPEFRTAFVQVSPTDPGVNGVRLANVQSEAARLVGPELAPPVVLRMARPNGVPAEDVDAIFKHRRENLSPPPELSGSGGGGGAQ